MNRYFLPCLLLISACVFSGCIFSAVVGGTTASSDAALDVRSLGRHLDDATIAAKIDTSLVAEKDLPSRWISAEVIEGRVVLTGYLPRQEQIDRAVYICRHISGVRSVQSEVKLGAPPAQELLADTWITAQIKKKLIDDPEIPGLSVHVETVSGKVYLQGIVKDRVQRHRAHTLAASVKGVASIVNMLRIRKK